MPPIAVDLGPLRSLVIAQARRWRRLQLLRAAGLAVAAPLAVLAAACLLDALVHLPTLGRAAAAAAVLGVAVHMAVRFVRHWRSDRLAEDAAALAIERATPGGVQNRLINSLQLARGSATGDADLTAAVVAENRSALEGATLEPAAPARPALVPVLAAVTLLLLGGLAVAVAPDRVAASAGRILLPFARIDPAYRTTLDVAPGDVEADGPELVITVHIRGERPDELVVLREVNGTRREERVAVPDGADTVTHTLAGIDHSQTYAVRGRDYQSPTFRIEVASPAALTALRATLTPPAYTGGQPRTIEVAGGDLEALAGTTADAVFTFDQPTDAASLVVQGQPAVALERLSATEYRGGIAFTVSTSYRLETRRGSRPADPTGLYAVRVLPDLPPRLELTGLAGVTEPAFEATLPLAVRATDDIGLDQVGLFARPLGQPAANQPDDGWVPVQVWPVGGRTEFRQGYELPVQALGAVEGGRVEVALRGRDTCPDRAGRWVTGPAFPLTVGGEGAALQVRYEQILRTEAELKAILAAQRELEEKSAGWLKKLDPGSGIRWDEAKNVDELHAALAALAKEQKQVQARTATAGRGILPEAGNLKLSVGLLADAEMTRAARALEAVAGQEQPRKRAALGEARVTQARTARSLAEMIEHFTSFRQDWEAEHAVPFVKMLADRQAALRDESVRQAPAGAPAAAAEIAARRQARVGELARLFAPALDGAGQRLGERDPELAGAFVRAGAGLKADPLRKAIETAAAVLRGGKWAEAVPPQTEAARHLAAVHEQLRKSLEDSARKALQALADKAKSDAEAQKAIAKLQAGTDKTFLDLPGKMQLTDVIHLQELTQAGKGDNEKVKPIDYLFPDSARGMLQQPDTGKRQQFDILKLATSPSKTPSFPKQSDREANAVKPHIQEKFDDLVGKLLEEADEMAEKYETYNLNAAFNINEPGEIGKQGGDLNSTAAAAATGNMKPPTTNVGGATRSGRQGARAHGMTVGDQSLNRRGRDKVQEGQERVGDQPGSMKQKLSDDPQKDTSTGIGGKKVESDDAKFSVADKGKWTDDMARRLDKAQAKQFIVERQDGKLDPKVGELFRDVNDRQEQLIERIKAIKKELRNLYLPTEHLDELEAQMNAALDRLKERPDAEAFRQHKEGLDRLRAAVRVFQAPAGGMESGTARDRAVRGRALDDPARAPLPGYEDATKRYYEQLSR